MREIKFRAWDRIDNEMNYDNFDLPIMEFNEGIRDMQEERYELMQFTGLHDKNGKEIYEGDIVRLCSQYETDDPVDSMHKIYFKNGSFRCCFHDMILNEKVCTGKEGNWNMEVIGNIYENPELLG